LPWLPFRKSFASLYIVFDNPPFELDDFLPIYQTAAAKTLGSPEHQMSMTGTPSRGAAIVASYASRQPASSVII
jgi:hypothetical protein